MDIKKELDRIQKAGCSVTLRWNRSVRFIGSFDRINVSTLMTKDDKDFDQTIYRAILAFDEKYPQYL